MKKYCLDLSVASVEPLSTKHVLLKLTRQAPLPPMQPGQFVEVRIDHSPATFLRRPISIHRVDTEHNELWLMVAAIGPGTRQLACLQPGDVLNCLLPLGRGFSMPQKPAARVLLVGGGVGVAPLLYQGEALRRAGHEPVFLLGARTAADVLSLPRYEAVGTVCVTTEDGSLGEQGFVTNHTILESDQFDLIQTCGPKPMMMAVARYAREHGICCEASLENMMACGLGACLCCVEKTQEGNLCVCKEGPVFNIQKLLW